MSTPSSNPPRVSQPSLAALTARMLDRRASEPGSPSDDIPAGVEPHEAPSGFHTDTRTTWSEALAAVRLAEGAGHTTPPPAPPTWAGLTRQLPPRFAVALCVGNYPQMLGEMSKLFAGADFARLADPFPDGSVRPDSGGERSADRVRKTHPELAVLLAAAGHRLSGEFDRAEELLSTAAADFAGSWPSVVENERAALLWDRGRTADAIAAWQRLPDGAVKALNLGMAELFSGRPGSAKSFLTAACGSLPETSGWGHIARLYLALCDRTAAE